MSKRPADVEAEAPESKRARLLDSDYDDKVEALLSDLVPLVENSLKPSYYSNTEAFKDIREIAKTYDFWSSHPQFGAYGQPCKFKDSMCRKAANKLIEDRKIDVDYAPGDAKPKKRYKKKNKNKSKKKNKLENKIKSEN